MKAPAFKDAGAGDIAPAVLAIGRPSFPQVLIDTLHRAADVGHCMVFTFEGERFTRVSVLKVGYSVDEVDRFSGRLIRYFSEGTAIGIDDVRTVTFRAQRGGYSEAQVDLLLDSVTDVMLAVR